MRKSTKIWALLLLVAMLATALHAITTFEKELDCPICKAKNKFYGYASWGSYVYHWPSKYQFLFWPKTYGTSIYICKRCNYAAYMWDWEDGPDKSKVAEVEKVLAATQVSAVTDDYNKVPVSERLAIATKVYETLGRDDEFWADLHRLRGYYLAREKKPAEAKEARLKSLEHVNRLLADDARKDARKEYLLIAGSMHHFTGNDEAALLAFKAARQLEYKNASFDAERQKGYNEYLNQLIDDCIKRIESGSGLPKDDGSEKED